MCLAAHYPKNDQPARRGRAIYLLYSNGQRLSLYPVEVMDWYKGIELAPVERTGHPLLRRRLGRSDYSYRANALDFFK